MERKLTTHEVKFDIFVLKIGFSDMTVSKNERMVTTDHLTNHRHGNLLNAVSSWLHSSLVEVKEEREIITTNGCAVDLLMNS